ncbi:hypothetical protein ACU4GD_44085 [Cupriavidus basilensis]
MPADVLGRFGVSAPALHVGSDCRSGDQFIGSARRGAVVARAASPRVLAVEMEGAAVEAWSRHEYGVKYAVMRTSIGSGGR